MRISRDMRKNMYVKHVITVSAKCIFPIEQGIQQALIGEYSQKADVAQAISRIASVEELASLRKTLNYGAVLWCAGINDIIMMEIAGDSLLLFYELFNSTILFVPTAMSFAKKQIRIRHTRKSAVGFYF